MPHSHCEDFLSFSQGTMSRKKALAQLWKPSTDSPAASPTRAFPIVPGQRSLQRASSTGPGIARDGPLSAVGERHTCPCIAVHGDDDLSIAGSVGSEAQRTGTKSGGCAKYSTNIAPDFYGLLRELVDAHERALIAARRDASPVRERFTSGASSPGCVSIMMPEIATCQKHPSTMPQLPGQFLTSSEAVQSLSGEIGLSIPGHTESETQLTEPARAEKSGGHGERGALELLRVWVEDQVIGVSSGPRRASFSFPAPYVPGSEEGSTPTSESASLIVHPGSMQRLVWDMLGLLLLAYDVIMIPFSLAFAPPPTRFTTTMGYATLTFWTMDIFASMGTGFYKGKHLVLEPAKIMKRYLKTWFGMDAFLVGLDWALFPPWQPDASGNSASRLGRSMRVMRFVRTLRLVRVLKLSRLWLELQDQINSEALSICFRVVRIILFLILANHIVACVWYAIGSSGLDPSQEGLSTWVIEHDMELRPLAYRYLTSLHWSLTQFTPASMEVAPESVYERLFAVGVLLFAMVTFSSFVSMLTSSMAQLRNISSDEVRQFWLLRRYLRDWQVSRRFALRLQRYLEYAYEQQRQRVQAKEVKLLALLSGPLHDELKARTLSTTLISHPLFRSANVCRCLHVFSRSLSEVHLGQGDCAFYCGERASSMLFICSGVFNYMLGQLSTQDDLCHPPEDSVTEGQWVAEPVLWSRWMHLGDLQAVTEGQVIVINAQSFAEAIQVYRPTWLAFRSYAERFVKEANKLSENQLTDLLHLHVPPQEIVDSSGFEPASSDLKSLASDSEGIRRWSLELCSNVAKPFARIFNRGQEVLD